VGAIEFAFTLPFLLFVALGVVELSLLMHRTHVVTRAARDACRTGALVIEGPEPTGAQIEAAAAEHALFALQAAHVPCEEGCSVHTEWFVS
jgi:Flp pilus assembly protein TadG